MSGRIVRQIKSNINNKNLHPLTRTRAKPSGYSTIFGHLFLRLKQCLNDLILFFFVVQLAQLHNPSRHSAWIQAYPSVPRLADLAKQIISSTYRIFPAISSAQRFSGSGCSPAFRRGLSSLRTLFPLPHGQGPESGCCTA